MIRAPHVRPAAILLLVATSIAISQVSASAQGLSGGKEVIDEKELAKYLQLESQQQQAMRQALEGAVDPASYIVGPGDLFTINFWGMASEASSIAAAVTPEGKLIIPTVGALDVIDRPLQLVQEEIRRACEGKYDPSKIRVTAHLTGMRLVRAHVYGEVATPGSYAATALDRVSYFLQQAGGWTQWSDERNVEIRHRDGSVDTLDMYKLYHEGDMSQDLYVRGGDVIYVPRIELTDQTVFVEGAVTMPGPHRIMRDETVVDFLYRVKALSRWSDFNEIFLLRKNQAPLRLSFFGDGAARANAHSLHMEHGDRVLVTGSRSVYVHGAVKNPGSFPFVAGYKAMDYVGLAGGMQDMGNLASVKVIHRDTGKVEKGADSEVKAGDALIVPVSLRTKVSQYLLIASQIATILIAASAVGVIQ